jgi:hypothetical protein
MKIRKKMIQTVAASALFALFASGAQAAAIPLANAGFETDDASGGDVFGATGWGNFGGGTYTTDGTNGPGAFPNCCSPVAASGVNSMKLFSTSGVQQDFTATAGEQFTMSGVGLNFGSDPILNSSKIVLQIAFLDGSGLPAGTEAGGQVAVGFNLFESNPIDATTAQDVWTAMGVGTAGAPNNTATVRFIGLFLNAGGGAGFIDDLSATRVDEVPVPAAIWLFGSGLVGLVGVARRKARS